MPATPYRRASLTYWMALIVFLGFVGLFLLTLVDMRRAFLFPLESYYKVGSPSVVLNFAPRHVSLLLLSGLGMGIAYWRMRLLEKKLKAQGADLKAPARLLPLSLGLFLVIDLFIYRGVPASRIMAAGKTGIGRAIPWTDFPAWLQPLGEALNYLLLVWHATLLGLLLGALFLATRPGFLRQLQGSGFRAHLAGAALAVPQPFCSCCAAPIGAALYRSGASLGPVLAFTVSAPMLNVTSLILASALLPVNLALLRIGGGLLLAVLVTYAASLIVARWAKTVGEPTRLSLVSRVSTRLVAGLHRHFQFQEGAPDSPTALLSRWLGLAWQLGRVAVPMLFAGAVLATAVIRLLPDYANNMAGVAIAAAVGTLLMIPTWTEIPIAAALVQEGLSGPAAALLLTLPAVSLPCLAVLTGAFGSLRVSLVLALLVFLAGLGAGAMFLYG